MPRVEKALEERLEKFLGCVEKTKKDVNEENVHDLRVSIRRLRAACYLAGRMNGKKIKVKELKKIMRASGEIRDCHVVLRMIRDLGGSQGIEELLSLKLQKSTDNFRKVLESIDVGKVAKSIRGIRVRETNAFDTLKIIADLFLKFRAFEDAGDDPYVLHRMRISLKRLRYSLELIGKVGILKEIQELQQLLGDIHDIDAFLERFGVYEEPLKERRRVLTSKLPQLVGIVNTIEPFIKVSMLTQEFRDAPEEAMEYAEYSGQNFKCYMILKKELGVDDKELLEAAILKDVLKGSATEEEVKEIFGERVAWLVSEVNEKEGESKEEFFRRLKDDGRDLVLLKLAEAKQTNDEELFRELSAI
ncbi:MAG: CHAD domain-containing protein [Candidatus Thermoplasmatota archaeon]|nr:CHAD domain-containing protein [Candidatus Thermoplasmatota archaeon]